MGLCLSEDHSKKLELQLCDFVLQEMKNEGSTHFRPECVSEAADGGNTSEKTNKNRPGSGGEPPLKKHKKTKKEKNNNEGEDNEAEEPQEPKTKKTKKEKKNKGDEEEEDSQESLPW